MINHPIPVGTRVVVEFSSCATCGPSHLYKVQTRIREIKTRPDGNYDYVLLDGRSVPWTAILEVK